MEGFAGFPDGLRDFTPVPDLFFSELMTVADDLNELKVSLYCLWLIQHKQGDVRCVTYGELAADEILLRGLGDRALPAAEALREALERAVARGTLLEITVARGDRAEETLYLLNSESGRAAMARIERGEWVPEDGDAGVQLRARRPNIYNLYEQNMGVLTPMLAEELKDAEQTYPNDWIEDAFRIAVANNARRWAYVRAILQRWAREGRARRRGDTSAEDPRSYAEGEFADYIKH